VWDIHRQEVTRTLRLVTDTTAAMMQQQDPLQVTATTYQGNTPLLALPSPYMMVFNLLIYINLISPRTAATPYRRRLTGGKTENKLTNITNDNMMKKKIIKNY